MDVTAMEALIRQALQWPPEELARKRLRRLSSSPDNNVVATLSACAGKLLMRLCWASESISDFLALMEEMDSFFVEEVKLHVVAALGETMSLLDIDDQPEVQLCISICELVVAGWMCPGGVVSAVDEIVATSKQQRQDGQHSSNWPHVLTLLECLIEAAGPELIWKRLVESGPNISAEVSTLDHSEARQRIPLLAGLVQNGPKGFAGKSKLRASRQGFVDILDVGGGISGGSSSSSSRSHSSDSSSSSDEGHAQLLRLPRPADSKGGQLGLEVVERLSSSEGGIEAYALLPIWLPPSNGLGPLHSGLLLGGRGNVIEEWDLEAGSRIDRFEIGDVSIPSSPSRDPHAGNHQPVVVSIVSPEASSHSEEVESLAAVVVQDSTSAGFAVLRRSKDPDAMRVNPNSGAHLEGPWQVDVPWKEGNFRGSQSKKVDRVSRGTFLHNSSVLMILGQRTQFGSNEVGLYDLGAGTPFELAAFARHDDFVTDVTCLSTHSFASTSFDGKAFLWDIRSGHDPVGHISGGVPKLALAAVTTAKAPQVLLGDLMGNLELLDLRERSRPLAAARISPTSSAIVRITTAPYQEFPAARSGPRQVVAAIATGEGLTSLSLYSDEENRQGLMRACSAAPLPAVVSAHKANGVSTRCYDIAAPKRVPNALLGACGTGGITRFRVRKLGLR